MNQIVSPPALPGVHMRAAAGANTATMQLFGNVGWDITASGVAAGLKEAGDGPLTIEIHSYGGDALAGIAIHNMLARHGADRTVVVQGIAASAASLIAMAGTTIIMPDNAFLMIHEAHGGAIGDAETMRKHAGTMDQVSAAYRKTYAARSGQTEDEVAALMAAETWFSAEQAVAAGFATEIAAPSTVRASAAQLSRFARVPATVLAAAAPASNTEPKEPGMPPNPNEPTPAANPPVNTPPAVPPAPAAPPAPVAATLAFVQGVAQAGKLDSDFIVAQIAGGFPEAVVRDNAINALAAKQAPHPTVPAAVFQPGEHATLLARMAGGLAVAVNGGTPAAESREFASMGMHGIMREILASRGERNVHRLTKDDLADRFLASGQHTTSDFAGVLGNTMNKVVREMYAGYSMDFMLFCEEAEYDDFKQISASNIGSFPEILPVLEAAPITYGTVGEETETYNIVERGRLLAISRAALINDDTRELQRMLSGAASGAYTGLRRAVYMSLLDNPNMADGNALFSNAHGNLGTAGPLNATTYGELRTKLGKQTGPGRTGQKPAPAPLPPPKQVVLVTGSDREGTALEMLGNRIVPTATGAVIADGYRASTQLVTDGFLSSGNNPFYLIRTDIKPIEVAFLRGLKVPRVTQAERIDYTGVTYRTMLDFGVKAITWRTAAGNLGT